MYNKLLTHILLLSIAALFTLSFMAIADSPQDEDTGWRAPAGADTLKNPFSKDADAWKKAEETYNTLCVVCHGEKGLGDGIAAIALKPRPTNLTLERVQKQSDGAIFWKLTNGKVPMAPYKESLTEEQRWQMVSFIRYLAE